MDAKLFTELQEVVCVAAKCPPVRPDLTGLPDVHYGNLYHIQKYEWFKFGRWFVSVIELPHGCIYSEDCFAPVMCLKELVEESKIEYVHE